MHNSFVASKINFTSDTPSQFSGHKIIQTLAWMILSVTEKMTRRDVRSSSTQQFFLK